MNKSTAIAASVVSALALAYTGASWYVGKSIERGNAAYLQELTQESGLLIVKEHSFQNNVFSSDETFVIAFPTCQTAAPGQGPLVCELMKQPVYLKATTHYLHGPVAGFKQLGLFTYQTTLGLDPNNDPVLLRETANLPNLSVQGLVKLNGSTTGQVKIPAIHPNNESAAAGKNTVRFVSEEITGEFEASKGLATVAGKLSIPLLSFTEAGSNDRIEVSGINIHDNWRRLSKHLFAGTDETTVDKIVFTIEPAKDAPVAQGVQLNLDKLSSHYEINESAGLMDFLHKLNGESLVIGGQQFGPFASESFLRHVKTSAMDNYLETTRNMDSLFRPVPAAGQQGEQLKALKAAIVDLSQTKPSFGFERLEFKLPGGDANFKLDLTVQGLTPSNLDNPAELLGKVDLQSAVSATENAIANVIVSFAKTPAEAEQAKQAFPAMVARLIAQGFLRREGDRLAANTSLADQKLTVNGKPIPLPNLPQGQMH